MTRVLVLGASGTIGHMMLKVLSEGEGLDVWGTVRAPSLARHFAPAIASKIRAGIDAENLDVISRVVAELKPDVVINCIGLVKQLAFANDPLLVLPVNAMLPHRLAHICALSGARLIHFSTDCVFNGARGNYTETDPLDATDLYGQSKFIGEVAYPHTLTLRTSFIGHELETSHELIEWFLKQEGAIKGFTGAIYTGLPTVVLSRIVRDVVLPRPELFGIYHVASSPISKYDLLKLVAKVYGKAIEIAPDDSVRIDRSLDGTKFRESTGYVAPAWPELIEAMHDNR
ncbi:dTDP-4-dehydrorhamnose reductase family protein [Rhizobium leguminosarum]|jgi:dTDP-4-dehydrorhamnose reductase|uniref:dTDP-4-dehydrorhamnose reductase family protein n=1 Tax=Rhizobium leguminosarum TaxID=384 RepID=UPI00102FA9E5|nr:SDR family oxidoreductase [Rhizobium leguminosarum]TAU87473.1 SDR family oxidoreductase [Rhizobium leguminosarum]TAV52004.1 SDR family oxidoreductase [Rhizobium leguminosarum]